MLIYLENFENGLDKLEKLIEEKQKKLVIDKKTNSVEIEHLQSELYTIILITVIHYTI